MHDSMTLKVVPRQPPLVNFNLSKQAFDHRKWIVFNAGATGLRCLLDIQNYYLDQINSPNYRLGYRTLLYAELL